MVLQMHLVSRRRRADLATLVLSLILISFQNSKIALQEYMVLLRSIVDNPIFSAEEREILVTGLDDSEELLGGEGNESKTLDSDCESQLDLLRIICDPYITRHRESMEIKVSIHGS